MFELKSVSVLSHVVVTFFSSLVVLTPNVNVWVVPPFHSVSAISVITGSRYTHVFMVWLGTYSDDMRGRTLTKNKGELWSLSKLNPSICLGDLEKTKRNFYNISLCPDRESNSLSPALKPQVLPLQPFCSITVSSVQTESWQSAGPSLQMCCSSRKAIHYSTWTSIRLKQHHYAEYSKTDRRKSAGSH